MDEFPTVEVGDVWYKKPYGSDRSRVLAVVDCSAGVGLEVVSVVERGGRTEGSASYDEHHCEVMSLSEFEDAHLRADPATMWGFK